MHRLLKSVLLASATTAVLATGLALAAERYTVVREGNAQAVDHILVSDAVLRSSPAARVEVARVNADFGEDNYADASVPVRVSDHDPVVLFLGR